MNKWIKSFFDLWPSTSLFYIEEDKEYTLRQLVDILKTKDVSPQQGNRIILKILDKLVKTHEEKEKSL